MEGRSSRNEQDRFNLLSGQFLLLATFILNVATTFGAVWTILTLGLGGDDTRGTMFTVNHDATTGDSISFHKNVEAPTLLVKDRLAADEISGETISLIAADGTANNRAWISLNNDYIAMQARSYGPSVGQAYSFRLNRQVDRLHVLGSIENLRSIRSSSLKSRENSTTPSASDLFISSNDQLELSGNLGVSVHSKNIVIESSDKIELDSREEAVEVRSAPGSLLMPNLRVHQENLDQLDQDNALSGDLSAALAGRGYLLCIRRSDGLVYRDRISCD